MINHKTPDDSAALIAFARRVTERYSSAYSDYMSDPVNKNRLQAVGEIKNAIPSKLKGNFNTAKKALLKIASKCEQDHEPAFDTEYGSGRPVFGNFLLEIKQLKSGDDCAPIRYAVHISEKKSDEVFDKIFLMGVNIREFELAFDFSVTTKPRARKIRRVKPEHVKFLQSYISNPYTWALKSIVWDFDKFDYDFTSYLYVPST